MADHDFLLAQQLQKEFDKETAALVPDDELIKSYEAGKAKSKSSSNNEKALSVIDPSFEITDPNPDVRALFIQFNDQYFWGKLAGVEVRWSPRMTLCAGVCHYEGRGGLCSIRLSVPLLKLRPRKDLVETLLHEMIHAFLFVTDNDRDRDGHGPNFQKHMHRINKSSGSHITIYHDFHDEVDNYRQHWWRCDGPCRSKKPYFGYVKRAMNRAPSANDFWWAEHALTCGGSYTKVKEPEGYGVKKKDLKGQKKEVEEQKGMTKDIRSFLQVPGKTTQDKGGTSGARGKPSSTASSSGSSADSSGTDFSSLDWGGGMWTPEKDTSNNHKNWKALETQNDKKNTSNNPQNWMVAKTKNDKDVQLQSGSSGVVEKFQGSGKMLGTASETGLSWLAQMRRQWSKNSANSSSQQSTQATGSGTGNTLGSDDSADNQDPSMHNTWSDDSHHSSFHVSSCEEDNWPTPEKFKIKNKKHAKGQPLKRKRAIIELSDSDKDDDFGKQTVSKAAKSAMKSKHRPFEHQSDSDSDIFQRMKAKAQSKNKGRRDAENKANAQPEQAKNDFAKHQHDKRLPLGDRAISDVGASASSAGHSSGETTRAEEQSVSLIACPVCQKKMPEGDINSHLDSCLS